MVSSREKKTYTSMICIDGKRMAAMREIAKTAFGEAFLFIEIYDGRFVVHANDKINVDAYTNFKDKYKLCRVKVYQELLEFPEFKNENKRVILP